MRSFLKYHEGGAPPNEHYDFGKYLGFDRVLF